MSSHKRSPAPLSKAWFPYTWLICQNINYFPTIIWKWKWIKSRGKIWEAAALFQQLRITLKHSFLKRFVPSALIPVSIRLVGAPLKLLFSYAVKLHCCIFLKMSSLSSTLLPLRLIFILGNEKMFHWLKWGWVWSMLHLHNPVFHQKMLIKNNGECCYHIVWIIQATVTIEWM